MMAGRSQKDPKQKGTEEVVGKRHEAMENIFPTTSSVAIALRHLWRLRGGLDLLILMAIVLSVPACRQQKAGEAVEGTVLDTAGKPVAEVRVFNSGDGPKPIETRTDASGRFRLEGLNSGPVYVFAEKADYRFAGLRTTAGATGVVVKLLRQTEPMPSRAVAAKSMPLDQQQKLARRMLEKLWAEDARSKRYYWVTMAMSRIDPELALRWSAELDP